MVSSKNFRTVVVLIALVTTACGGQSAGDPTTTAVDSIVPTTEVSTPATSEPVTTTATTPVTTSTTAPLVDEAANAWEEWTGALSHGDVRQAWDLMAQSSRDALGSYELFSSMGSAMAEGWGAWSHAEDVTYTIDEDDAGRTLLIVEATVSQEGMTERRNVGIPVDETDGHVLVSPFEEFGNVATGLEQEAAGTEPPPVPADSGQGRRIVYSNSDQRVWLVEEDGSVYDTYLVSGKKGVPEPGTYEVFSKDRVAFAGHDNITMSDMVRFAHGENLAIGFHAIPNDGNGMPLQSEDELGEYRSAGCVRQSPGHAHELYAWAEVGTTVVVLS